VLLYTLEASWAVVVVHQSEVELRNWVVAVMLCSRYLDEVTAHGCAGRLLQHQAVHRQG
jgi:hypothetical protein